MQIPRRGIKTLLTLSLIFTTAFLPLKALAFRPDGTGEFFLTDPRWMMKGDDDDDGLLTFLFGPGPCRQITAKELFEKGPQFPEEYDPNNLSVQGLIKGNGKLLLRYKLEEESSALLTLTAGKSSDPFLYRLTAQTTGVQKRLIDIPARFGDEWVPATIHIQATKNTGAGEARLGGLTVYSIGVVEASGFQQYEKSVLVGDVSFAPSPIYPKGRKKEEREAAYRFKVLKQSSKAKMLVMHDDGTHKIRVLTLPHKGPFAEGDYVEGKWNGRDKKGKISDGGHRPQPCVFGEEGPWQCEPEVPDNAYVIVK